MKKLIVGCLERVSLPEYGVHDEWAKVDTGAYSGALHCTDIRIVRRGLTRKRFLRFTPLGDAALATETDAFKRTFVRSATGHRMRRYIVTTTIIIQGQKYPVTIGLSDRSDMKRPILLGRRFLREYEVLVDVRINQEFDEEGENTV